MIIIIIEMIRITMIEVLISLLKIKYSITKYQMIIILFLKKLHLQAIYLIILRKIIIILILFLLLHLLIFLFMFLIIKTYSKICMQILMILNIGK